MLAQTASQRDLDLAMLLFIVVCLVLLGGVLIVWILAIGRRRRRGPRDGRPSGRPSGPDPWTEAGPDPWTEAGKRARPLDGRPFDDEAGEDDA